MLKPGCYLGFDFGMRFIGVASGQSVTATANALTILKAVDGIPDWSQIDALVNQWQPLAMIVGLPYSLEGGEQEISFAARKFARRLRYRYQLAVHLVDERLTTKAAMAESAQSVVRLNQSKAGQRVDSIAAKIILESWLRTQQQKDSV